MPLLAGVEGIEPSAYGFGDRRSTSWAKPLYEIKIGGPSGTRTRDRPVMSRML